MWKEQYSSTLDRNGVFTEHKQNRPEFVHDAMELWGDVVYRFALSQIRSREDAEDLVQDVFLTLLLEEKEFNDQEHVKAWLLRTAINRCKNFKRSRSVRGCSLPLDESVSTDSLTFPGSDEGLVMDQLRQVLSSLPDKQRIAVHLHYIEGYKIFEIARIVGCTPVAARARLYRGRRSIEKALGDDSL